MREETQHYSLLQPRVALPFIAVTLIWGTTWFVIRDQLAVVPPGWSVTYRFTLAGVVMLALAKFRREELALGREGMIFAALLGLAQFTFNFSLVYQAERYITSGLVAVVFAILFAPNAFLARIFLGHKVSKRFVFGSVLGALGIGILFVNELKGDQTAILTGLAFTLTAVMCASTANVMQATERAKSLPMFSMIGWAMLSGALLDAIMAWIMSGPPVVELRASYLLGVAYLGIFGSAIAFPLYFTSIRQLGAAKAAYSSTLIPVVAMLISTMLEGYRWTGLAVVGSLVALVGMVIALSAPKPST